MSIEKYVLKNRNPIHLSDNSNPVIAVLPWYENPKQRNAYAGVFGFGVVFVAFFGIAFYKKGERKYLIICLIGLGCLGAAGILGFLVLPTTAHGQGTYDVVYYYHNDHLGTPLRLTTDGGNVVWSADYLPFGEVKIDSTSTITNNFRFPGQYYDEETGLYYNWFRYYSTELGRYLTPDLIGISLSYITSVFPSLFRNEYQNLFLYVGGNPLNDYDQNGAITWVVAGAVIGAAINVTANIAAQGWGNVTGRQLAAAALSGSITGAVGALSGPVGGTFAKSLGAAATGWLGITGAAIFSAGGGYAGQVVANAIDPCHLSSPETSAIFSGIGAGIASAIFPNNVLNSVAQANYFQPTQWVTVNQSQYANAYGASAGLATISVFGPSLFDNSWPFP